MKNPPKDDKLVLALAKAKVSKAGKNSLRKNLVRRKRLKDLYIRRKEAKIQKVPTKSREHMIVDINIFGPKTPK